ncbi:TetR-like C-terminal domain-containing protein [Nonomuraea rhodomycinica]|uniref:TetR-like C-terminal domain-containing protein n=1 Tax=Nonomuraea rhodomycinica TaxID=1712872 RepID=UPI0035E40D7F
MARALRRWALDDPQRYFLVYGTPVPGYHAPDDITAIASEIMATCSTPAPRCPPAAPRRRSTPTSRTTGGGRAATPPRPPPCAGP